MWMMSSPMLAPTVTHHGVTSLWPHPVVMTPSIVPSSPGPQHRSGARSTSPVACGRGHIVMASPRVMPQPIAGGQVGVQSPGLSGCSGLTWRSPSPARPEVAAALSPKSSLQPVPPQDSASARRGALKPLNKAAKDSEEGPTPKLLLDHRKPLSELAASNSSEYSPRDSVWKRHFNGGAVPSCGVRPAQAVPYKGHDSRASAPILAKDISEATPNGCSPHGLLGGSEASTWGGSTSRADYGSLADSGGRAAMDSAPLTIATLDAVSTSEVIPIGRACSNSSEPMSSPPSPLVTQRQQESPASSRRGAKGDLEDSPSSSVRAARASLTASPSELRSARVKAVIESCENITLDSLRNICGRGRPHSAVRAVVETTLMLLGFREATWFAAKVYLQDAESFILKMRNFDPLKDASRLQFQKLRRSLGYVSGTGPFLDQLALTVCPPIKGLVGWLRAVSDLLSMRFSGPGSPGSRPAASGNDLRGAGQPRTVQDLVRSRAAATASLEAKKPDKDTSKSMLNASNSKLSLSSSTLNESQDAGGKPGHGSVDESGSNSAAATSSPQTKTPNTMDDLEVLPDLRLLSLSELRRVRDFTIRRPNVGEILFHGEIDLVAEHRTLEQLASIVRLELGECFLYPDRGSKPEEGKGLNRPATVTLYGCNQAEKINDAESSARYREKIKTMTEVKGAQFLDYDGDKGIWKFRIERA